MTDPTEIARVAAGLTRAQREAFAEADEANFFCPYFSELYADDNMLRFVEASAAHHDPDCLPENDGGTIWSFTSDGRLLRDHILREKSGG